MIQTTDHRVIEVTTEAYRAEAVSRDLSILKDALDEGWMILSEVAANNRLFYVVGKPKNTTLE